MADLPAISSACTSSRGLTTDPYDILLGHNRWANEQILLRARTLTSEQFHRQFNIGLGSLHDTMLHVLGCIRSWCDRIDMRPPRPSIGGRAALAAPFAERDPAKLLAPNQLIAFNDEVCADLADVVKRARHTGAINQSRLWAFGSPPTARHRFTVAAAILHLTNHGMHHRAQCMNILKQLGHPVNADLDELEWQIAGEP